MKARSQPATSKGTETRRRLLQAATAELLEGDGSLELAAVAARGGVSAGLPYRYFGSKAGLLEALVDDFFDRFDQGVFLPDFAEAGSWHDRERVRVEKMVNLFYTDPIARFAVGRLAGEHSVVSVQQSRVEQQVVAAARNIRHGQRTGELDARIDAPMRAALSMGGIHRLLMQALSSEPRPTAERVVEEIVAFTRAVIPEA